jgi:hypothetical protein
LAELTCQHPYDDVDGASSESTHPALTAYLFSASVRDRHLVVKEASRPLMSGVPRLISGTQPIDDGYLIMDEEERTAFLSAEPLAAAYVRPFIGTEEFLYGRPRYILALRGVGPTELRKLPLSVGRLNAVRAFRQGSRRGSTLSIADEPARFNVEVIPAGPFLVVPEVSSERRKYVPIGWREPPTIPSNLLRVMLDANLWHFGVLTSAMHMAWLAHIGGRLESRYRYSAGLVFNTFAWPAEAGRGRQRVEAAAQTILDVRASYPEASLADLYDPDVMPSDLRKAHKVLDDTVDRLYKPTPFGSDRERAEHLFGLYERLTGGLLASPRRGRKKTR